jgi:hypothetical protein
MTTADSLDRFMDIASWFLLRALLVGIIFLAGVHVGRGL